ncbi:MAG TPA: NADP-dependent oxidoreductase [Solirubrobacteraceae bacterium]|jgi:NADPH:quinone reductase-like Zn-dependent oxidoreductase
MRAVRFDHYGGVEVLDVADVDPPVPGPGQLLVRVRAAGINLGESKIREGLLHDLWPSTFPSGQGSDLAGIVEQACSAADAFHVGDEVIGFTHDRSSHAELVVVEPEHVTARPDNVDWEVAGSLFVAGTTAYAAVRAVAPTARDTVVIAGAAGGVGSIAVQLARQTGAAVLGIAGEHNHDWLRGHGVVPVAYGPGTAERVRALSGGAIDAFIDTVGNGYVELALELGAPPDRIDTIADFAAVERYGVKAEGNRNAARSEVLAELADQIAHGSLEVPIARVYALDEVRDAYRELERHHTRGKIVLAPSPRS